MSDPYARSTNPPRRAKRARTDDDDPEPSSGPSKSRASFPPPHRPASADAPPPDDSDSEEEDEYEPGSAAAPKRRGRKPGAMSRSARESLRKLNHSRIEKARRTKINETLATLSALVSEADAQKARESGAPPVPPPPAPKKGKGRPEEKEFKLDVLVKTVAYMQELLERVKALEAGGCVRCAAPREQQRQHEHSGMAIDAPDEPLAYSADDERSRREGSLAASAQYVSPRLPPIASWLPHPHLDPSAIAALTDAPAMQLPSPPPSGTFRPSLSIANVPALALPGPAARMSASPRAAHAGAAAGSARAPRRNTIDAPRASSSAERSPTWTPEDESAASLLLHISSSPSSTASTSSVAVSAFSLPKPAEMSVAARAGAGAGAGRVQVETPSSLLGLGRE